MTKSKKNSIILFLLISSFILGIGLFNLQNNNPIYLNQNSNNKLDAPKIAQSLSSSDVHLNASVIYRDIDSINITINASKFQPDVDDVNMILTHKGYQIREAFEMTSQNNGNYTQIYSPIKNRFNDPVGLIDVTFRLYDAFNNKLADETLVNFTIKSNYVLQLNDDEFYKEDSFYGELQVDKIGDTFFEWNVSVSDTTSPFRFPKFNLGINITSFRFTINDTFTEGSINNYIRIELINTSKPEQNWLIHYNFTILTRNSNPSINASSITFNPDPLYRTKECNLTFDVSDAETATSNLDVSILIEGPELERLEFDSDEVSLVGTDTFSINFTISATQSVGSYEVEITVTDPNGGSDAETAYIKVINNPPKINSFKINDKEINESITVNYGQVMSFTFNVTDEEGIDYITVALYNEDANWFNITQQYSENMNFTIRTVDLSQGTWNVFIYVTDINGETSGLGEDYNLAPKQIKIERRTIEGVLPWLTLTLGLVFGGLISIGFASTWMKSKVKRLETKEFKDKQPKKVKRKTKKKQTKRKTKETKKIPSEETGGEKEEKKEKKQTQRKIKRKL